MDVLLEYPNKGKMNEQEMVSEIAWVELILKMCAEYLPCFVGESD